MAKVAEIGPGLYRISVFLSEFNMEFNHFLLDDDEPLLFHTGYNATFDEVRDGLASVLDPSRLRWISYSHFESDECGSLNKWLEAAPHAEPVCSDVSAMVNLTDFSLRPPKALAEGEVLTTGKRRFRLCRTPHLPHGWDAAFLFEETSKTLLCSDLFHHMGENDPVTGSDVVSRCQGALKQFQESVFADYAPYTPNTERLFQKLAALQPTTLAVQHGSSFTGDGERALKDLGRVFKEIFGGK